MTVCLKCGHSKEDHNFEYVGCQVMMQYGDYASCCGCREYKE